MLPLCPSDMRWGGARAHVSLLAAPLLETIIVHQLCKTNSGVFQFHLIIWCAHLAKANYTKNQRNLTFTWLWRKLWFILKNLKKSLKIPVQSYRMPFFGAKITSSLQNAWEGQFPNRIYDSYFSFEARIELNIRRWATCSLHSITTRRGMDTLLHKTIRECYAIVARESAHLSNARRRYRDTQPSKHFFIPVLSARVNIPFGIWCDKNGVMWETIPIGCSWRDTPTG